MRILIFLLISAYFVSCSHSHDEHDGHTHENEASEKMHEEEKISEDEHAHEHDENALSYTIFSDGYELFVEFPPFVINTETSLTSHFTMLDTYKPVTDGSLTVILNVEGKEFSSGSTEIARTGIFIPKIKPAKTGHAELIFKLNHKGKETEFHIGHLDVLAAEGESGVHNHDEEHAQEAAAYDHDATEHEHADDHDAEHDHAAENMHPETHGEPVTFLKEEAWKIDFGISEVKSRPFSKVVKTTAEAMPSQGNLTIAAAKSGGIVRYGNVNIKNGTYISKDQILFYISGSGLKDDNINARISSAKIALEKSSEDFARAEKLLKDKLISREEYLRHKAEKESAELLLNNLTNDFKDGSLAVKAPASGYISAVFVQNGSYVSEGASLLSIASTNKLTLRADLSQQQFYSLNGIGSASFEIPNTGQAYTLEELNGKISSVGASVDPATLTVPIYFEINNSQKILPGSYLSVYVKGSLSEEVTAVPKSAVLEKGGIYYVYVQTSGESYEKRIIQTAGFDGQYYSILSGLHPHEYVVTKGAYRLMLASNKSELPDHGHVH